MWKTTWIRFCVEGHGERTNKEVVEAICSALDDLLPAGAPPQPPGHDRSYAIDPTRISSELGWQPRHSLEQGLAATVAWYLGQQKWCRRVREQGGYGGGRTHAKKELGFRVKLILELRTWLLA